MAAGKNLVPGSAQMLLLRLLAERDMYGYQMIEELAQRSNDTFALKAGTLYPILHALEADGSIESYEQPVDRIAGIADVSASSYIVWMQDIHAVDSVCVHILRNSAICLLCEKCGSCLRCQTFLLWKCLAIFDNLVPDRHHCLDVIVCICSYFDIHGFILLSYINPTSIATAVFIISSGNSYSAV